MTTAYETAAEVSGEREEKVRSIVQDYTEVFASETGKRVLGDLIDRVLLMRRPLLRTGGEAPQPLSGNDALYLLGRHDAAREILHILNTDYASIKPTIRRSPYSKRG